MVLWGQSQGLMRQAFLCVHKCRLFLLNINDSDDVALTPSLRKKPWS